MATVKLKDVRLAFPSLFTPKAIADGDPTYSGAFAIEPGSANAKALAEAVNAVAKEKWKEKAAAILKELKSKDRVCFKEAALSKDGQVYDGFEGKFSLNASSKVRPTVIDRDKSPLVADDGKPYAGCYVNVNVDIWAMDNQYGKRICASLGGVQFSKDGEAFGASRPASVDDFDDLSVEEDAEALV